MIWQFTNIELQRFKIRTVASGWKSERFFASRNAVSHVKSNRNVTSNVVEANLTYQLTASYKKIFEFGFASNFLEIFNQNSLKGDFVSHLFTRVHRISQNFSSIDLKWHFCVMFGISDFSSKRCIRWVVQWWHFSPLRPGHFMIYNVLISPIMWWPYFQRKILFCSWMGPILLCFDLKRPEKCVWPIGQRLMEPKTVSTCYYYCALRNFPALRKHSSKKAFETCYTSFSYFSLKSL